MAEPRLEEILLKYELRLGDMTFRCSYPVRVRMAAQLVDWKLAGHYLGLTQLKLHTIQVDNDSEEQRRGALLETWAEMEGEKATYMKLAEALFEHGRRDLVEHLCKMIRRVLRCDVQSKTPPQTRRKSKSDVPISPISVTCDQHPIDIPEDKIVDLAWESDGQVAPQTMSRWADTAVSGTKVYFLPGATYARNILAYQTTNGSWSEFRSSPHTNCSLTVIKDTLSLTTIGGGGFPYTNKVYSFSSEGRCGLWTESLIPPMTTRRQWTAVLHHGIYVIVAGGWGSANEALATVEVLNVETQKWYGAEKLPEPLYHASMTLCGGHVVILGGYDELKKPTRVVYTCSLTALLESDGIYDVSDPLKHQTAFASKVWKRVTDLPVTESTAVSLYDQLLAIGGRDCESISTPAVYKYSFVSNSWDVISHMLTPRHLCFAAVIPDNRVLVVGGESGRIAIDSVEVATSSIIEFL